MLWLLSAARWTILTFSVSERSKRRRSVYTRTAYGRVSCLYSCMPDNDNCQFLSVKNVCVNINCKCLSEAFILHTKKAWVMDWDIKKDRRIARSCWGVVWGSTYPSPPPVSATIILGFSPGVLALPGSPAAENGLYVFKAPHCLTLALCWGETHAIGTEYLYDFILRSCRGRAYKVTIA